MEWLTDLAVLQDVIRPVLDITILSFLIYQTYRILLQTRAVQLVRGALIIGFLYIVAFLMQLETLLWIMNGLATVIVIILAVVFQPELRNIFTRIGRGDWFSLNSKTRSFQLDSILNAVDVLSGIRRGCLIVISRKVGLKNILETGTALNADLSTSLILTIFSHDTPLHDGAAIISGGKLVGAGCFLPLSEQSDIRRSFGTRHRAALGMAEETDAIILVVSEETGAMSLAYDANLYYDLTLEEMQRTLKNLINPGTSDTEDEEQEAVFEN